MMYTVTTSKNAGLKFPSQNHREIYNSLGWLNLPLLVGVASKWIRQDRGLVGLTRAPDIKYRIRERNAVDAVGVLWLDSR